MSDSFSLMMVDTGEANSGQFQDQQANSTATLLEVANLISYIRRVVHALLEENEISNALRQLLLSETTLEQLKKFIQEPQARSILVQRQILKGKILIYHSSNEDVFLLDDEDEEATSNGNSDENVIYSICSEVKYLNPKISSLVFIKQSSILEAEKPLSAQLRIMNLNDSLPYETLHSYVSAAVAPYFKSFVKETGRAERFV